MTPRADGKGLEPISATQGGAVAWSLDLHHPYNPANPIDSLTVAARAINNIIGGASLTGSNGKPTVQPGLESSPANCLKYTGSAAVITRNGYPGICASSVSTTAGRAALVADVYQQWSWAPRRRSPRRRACCSRTPPIPATRRCRPS